MTVERLIFELLTARAELAHARSTDRRTSWRNLTANQRDRFMSVGRLQTEPFLLKIKMPLPG